MNEYKAYISLLNEFQKLLHCIPNSIYFPLFEINCEKVKDQIYKIIEDSRMNLLKHLEEHLIDLMKGICGKYSGIIHYIRRNIVSAEDAEAMEKYMLFY